MYKLLEMVDGSVVREHRLPSGVFRIGRLPGNDLQPDNASVSGRHAAITVSPSPYLDGAMEARLEDLDSTNGTRVNGIRITRHLLKHCDMLSLGALTLKFIDEQALALEGTRILLEDDQG